MFPIPAPDDTDLLSTERELETYGTGRTCALRHYTEREEWEGLFECRCGRLYVTYVAGRALCFVRVVGHGWVYGQVWECDGCGGDLRALERASRKLHHGTPTGRVGIAESPIGREVSSVTETKDAPAKALKIGRPGAQKRLDEIRKNDGKKRHDEVLEKAEELARADGARVVKLDYVLQAEGVDVTDELVKQYRGRTSGSGAQGNAQTGHSAGRKGTGRSSSAPKKPAKTKTPSRRTEGPDESGADLL